MKLFLWMGKAPTVEEGGTEERHEKKSKKREKATPQFCDYDMLRMKIPKNRDAVSHRFFGDRQE